MLFSNLQAKRKFGIMGTQPGLQNDMDCACVIKGSRYFSTSLTIDETTMTDTVTAVASKQKSKETEKLKMHDKIR